MEENPSFIDTNVEFMESNLRVKRSEQINSQYQDSLESRQSSSER
jgi:hypothetical protein